MPAEDLTHLDEHRKVAGMVVLSAANATQAYNSRFDKTPQHTSRLSGQQWIDELMAGHSARFFNELGMHKFVFKRLLQVLERDGSLSGTRHVSASEQLATFLHYARRGLCNRALQERFQRSGDTIAKSIHRLLHILTSAEIYGNFVKLPTGDTPISTKITRSTLLHRFKDCVGALDGTHIPAHVPEEKRASYRNRKGQLSQNALAACDMDMRFTYVLSGWEGSAADSRVFEDARSTDFTVPEGRYYLGDAGYALSDLVLVPYRGVRYHIKEWGQARQRPRDHKELFNYRHALLRNHIERIFGLFKRRFKVLLTAQEYSLKFQAQLIPALAVIHNFIRIHDPDDLFELEEESHGGGDAPDDNNEDEDEDDEDNNPAAARREKLAEDMWADYRSNRDRRIV